MLSVKRAAVHSGCEYCSRNNKTLVPCCTQVSEERAIGASLLISGLKQNVTICLSTQLLGNAFLGECLSFFPHIIYFYCNWFFPPPVTFQRVTCLIYSHPPPPSRQGGNFKGHKRRLQRDASLLGTRISGPSAGCHGVCGWWSCWFQTDQRYSKSNKIKLSALFSVFYFVRFDQHIKFSDTRQLL